MEMFHSLFLTLYINRLSKINQSKSVTSSLGLTFLIISQSTIFTTFARKGSSMRSLLAGSDGVIVTYRITVSSLARVLRR